MIKASTNYGPHLPMQTQVHTNTLLPLPRICAPQTTCWYDSFVALKYCEIVSLSMASFTSPHPTPTIQDQATLHICQLKPSTKKMLCRCDKGWHTWKKAQQWWAESKETKWNIRNIRSHISLSFERNSEINEKILTFKVRDTAGALGKQLPYHGQDLLAHTASRENTVPVT